MAHSSVERIRSVLQNYRTRLAAEFMRTGLLISILAGVFLIGGSITAESLWYLDPGTKTALLWITGAVVAFIVFSSGAWVGFIGAGGAAAYSDTALARRLGKKYPEISDKISNALSLLNKRDEYGYSESLTNLNLQQVAEIADQIDPREAVSDANRKRVQKLIAVVTGFWLLIWIPFPAGVSGGMARMFQPNTEFQEPLPFTFQISPGNVQVLTEDPVKIMAKVQGDIPDEVFLTRDSGNEEATIPLSQDSLGTYVHTFSDIDVSFAYYLHAPSSRWWSNQRRISSPTYQVQMLRRPQVQSLRIRLIPPEYSGLEPREQAITSTQISALKGTQVQINATANKPVESAIIHFSHSQDSLTFDIEATELRSTFRLLDRDAFTIRLTDFQGNSNSHPASYTVIPLQDAYPSVEIVQPEGDVDLGESLQLPLIIGLQDDYGISRLALEYQVQSDYMMDQDTTLKQIRIPMESTSERSFEVGYAWDLNPLRLSPRDRVRYRVVTWDNDDISGPKAARTPFQIARFPSLGDMYARTEQQQTTAMDQAEEVAEYIQSIKKKVDELTLQMKKREELNWQQEQEAQEILKSHEELKEKLEEIDQQLSEMLEQAQKHQLFSEQVMEKYQQLQQLFNDVLTPELESALQKLQEAIDQSDPEEVRQAMEELQMNEEELSENLDRAMELFTRVKIEQQTEEIVRRVNELLEQQQNISEMADSAGANKDDLSQSQQTTADEYEITEKRMEELRDLMQEFENLPNEEMQNVLTQAQQDSILQNMQQARQQFQQNEMQQGKQNSQKSSEGLQNLSQMMQQMQQQQQQQMMAEIMDDFRDVLRNVLTLSQEQEDLQKRTRPLQRKSPQLEALANEQQNLQINLQHVAAQLFELSQKTFGVTRDIGRALGESASNMQQSLEELAQRRASQSADMQNKAMASLNETAQQLLASMNSLQNQGSSTGFENYLQQMQELTQQQQQLNQQSSSMGQSGMPSFARQKAMQQMAAEQMGIRQSLQQIQRGMQGSGNQPLGDLDKIGEDMEEVAEDFRSGEFKRQTLERQQQILSRMLDAQKSLRTRDFEKKRESQVAEDIERSGPEGLPADLGERRNMLQEDLDRALQEGYDQAYEEVLRNYFNQLSRSQTESPESENTTNE